MTGTIDVMERGRRIRFSFEDVLRYHGPGSPGGAAIAFKALERALPLLDPSGPCERREIIVETAFGGPGARDGFELVTRAVTGERFRVDRVATRVAALAAVELANALIQSASENRSVELPVERLPHLGEIVAPPYIATAADIDAIVERLGAGVDAALADLPS